MSQRDLTSFSGKLKPQLAVYYEKGSKDVFHSGTIISKSNYPKFLEAERKLLKNSIYPKDYAYGIMKYLKDWTRNKGWKKLPIAIFCGDWAIGLYCSEIKSINFTDTPEDDMLEGMLLHDELIVARYAASKGLRIDQAVDELKLFVSSMWLHAYKNNKRAKVVERALDILSVEEGRVLNSYGEFLRSTELYDDDLPL